MFLGSLRMKMIAHMPTMRQALFVWKHRKLICFNVAHCQIDSLKNFPFDVAINVAEHLVT